MTESLEPNAENAPWPNQQPVPDGVEDVSQDPDLFADEDDQDGGD